MNCPYCDSDAVRVRSDAVHQQKIGRHSLRVEGITESVCDTCGEVFVTPEQHDANIERIRETSKAITPMSARQIRETRARLGLTQADAQKIFGGGRNAFSKYENGKVVPSESLAKLLRLADTMPAVLHRLATDAGVPLRRVSEAAAHVGTVQLSPTMGADMVTRHLGTTTVVVTMPAGRENIHWFGSSVAEVLNSFHLPSEEGERYWVPAAVLVRANEQRGR